MDSFLRDVRHAVRNLLRTPGFALTTILTLALGIGANTAIFSVVNAVILRPLGYPRPDQLMYISSQFPAMGFDQFWVSPPEYLELQALADATHVHPRERGGDANEQRRPRPAAGHDRPVVAERDGDAGDDRGLARRAREPLQPADLERDEGTECGASIDVRAAGPVE